MWAWLLATSLAAQVAGVEVEVQQGPMCLVAASASVSRHAGHGLTTSELSKHTVMHADGTSLFEVQRALDGLGVETLVASLDDAELTRLLSAGVPVVVNHVLGPDRVHAVVLVGFDGPASAPSGWTVLDPRDGRARTLRSFDRASVADGGLFVRRVAEAAGVPLDALVRRDREQRAHGWYRMAMAHERPTRGQRTLLERALRYDPAHSGARAALAAHEAR
jgi:hypothetical protein